MKKIQVPEFAALAPARFEAKSRYDNYKNNKGLA